MVKIKKLIKELKQIREIATMNNANFDAFGENGDLDKQIKEKTKLWRETWIISPLDNIIKQLEEGTQKKL